MTQIEELVEQRNALWKRADNFKEERTVYDAFITLADEANYNAMMDEVCQLDLRIAELKKPPLGAEPYWLHAWSRIGELAEAICRQYETAHGDPKLVSRWAEEIRWQCAMIQSLEEGENDGGEMSEVRGGDGDRAG